MHASALFLSLNIIIIIIIVLASSSSHSQTSLSRSFTLHFNLFLLFPLLSFNHFFVIPSACLTLRIRFYSRSHNMTRAFLSARAQKTFCPNAACVTSRYFVPTFFRVSSLNFVLFIFLCGVQSQEKYFQKIFQKMFFPRNF